MKNRRTIERFSEELRKTAGNTLFTIAGALVVFVLVDSVVDTNKHVGVVGSIVYLIVAIALFLFGGILLNSIRKTERDKVRYIAGESSRYILVRIDGERPPRTEQPVPPTKQSKKRKKQK